MFHKNFSFPKSNVSCTLHKNTRFFGKQKGEGRKSCYEDYTHLLQGIEDENGICQNGFTEDESNCYAHSKLGALVVKIEERLKFGIQESTGNMLTMPYSSKWFSLITK